MERPVVSICIPNFNNGRYLEKCLRSAVAQDFCPTEIVFVDDCSTDHSLDIARSFSGTIGIHVNATNEGQPAATNRCVHIAQGQYILILHSDDALLPHFTRCLLPLLERFPNAGMAVGERLETDETDVPREIAPFYDGDYCIVGEKQAKVFLFASFLPCQVLFRKSVYLEAGGIDPRHIVNLDGLLWFRMALKGDVAYIREPVGLYRKHRTSTTSKYNQTIDHMIEYYNTLKEMFRIGQNHPDLTAHYPDAIKRVAVLALRYCHGVIQDGNWDLARRFMALAQAFDLEISSTREFEDLQSCLMPGRENPLGVYSQLFQSGMPTRSASYRPPEGSVPLCR